MPAHAHSRMAASDESLADALDRAGDFGDGGGSDEEGFEGRSGRADDSAAEASGEAPNALLHNIRTKGSNSYYYAHAPRATTLPPGTKAYHGTVRVDLGVLCGCVSQGRSFELLSCHACACRWLCHAAAPTDRYCISDCRCGRVAIASGSHIISILGFICKLIGDACRGHQDLRVGRLRGHRAHFRRRGGRLVPVRRPSPRGTSHAVLQ